MDCTTCQSLLVEYAYDELDDARRDEVTAALARCPECRAELAVLQATRAAFEEPEALELSARRRADVLREARLAADRTTEAAAPWWSALLSPAMLTAATLLVAGTASWWIVRGGADAPAQDVATVATAEEAGGADEIDPHLQSTAQPEHLEEEDEAAIDVPSIADSLREQAAALAEAPSQGAMWDEAPSAEPAPPARSGYLENERLTNAMLPPVEGSNVATGLGGAGIGRSGGAPGFDDLASGRDSGARLDGAASTSGALSQQQAAAAPSRRPAAEPAAPAPASAAPAAPSVGDSSRTRAGEDRSPRAAVETVARNEDSDMAELEDSFADSVADREEAGVAPAADDELAEAAPMPQEMARSADAPTTGGLSGRSASGGAVAAPAPDEATVAAPEEAAAGVAFGETEATTEFAAAAAADPLQAGLDAYDAGDWSRAATLLHAARSQPNVDVGTAVYYEAAALAALGDRTGALSLLEQFDAALAGHLLAGEARRLRDTLQERAPDAANREMLRDNVDLEPADAMQEAEPR